MAVDERRRSHLYEQLAGAVGEEAAVTMFELLPPPATDLATRADLDRLEARMDHGFASVDQRFEQVDLRFQQIDLRFEQIEQRFEQIEERFGERLDGGAAGLRTEMDAMRAELLAAFRGEIVAAVSGQTRAVILAVGTTIVGLAGLALAVGQLL